MSAAVLPAAAPLPSTSGRFLQNNELRCGSPPQWSHSRPVQFAAPRQQQNRAGRDGLMVATAAFRRNKDAYKKYMSRQDLEAAYYKEWDHTTKLSEEEKQRQMTALTLLAFLPNFFRFYVIPGPARYVLYTLWGLVEDAAHQLRKLAVIAGLKLEAATMQRRGLTTAGYALRQTALRRLHGKESLLAPVKFALGGQRA